ncbi:MAG: aminopeptidase N C-terminal domain-containing protein, partial [Candidatus Thiodiazotropha sp.]
FELDDGFVAAFRQVLSDTESDQALLSELLTLPSESSIGDQLAEVAVDGIHHARRWLKQALAQALREDFLRVYRDNLMPGYEISSEAIARRRLKNLSLGYLMSLEQPEIDRIALDQFESAGNMTDVMAALVNLVNRDIPERSQALEQFEQKWSQDPLVMDKWFAVQAGSQLPGTLDRVKSLMNHAAFSLRNPNKVRSLIGAFCAGNPAAFHNADGSGYRFLADQVIALDGMNPQIAARLLRMMSRWRRYDERRQALMRQEFERVLAQKDISRDVFEIASKSLAD